MSRRILALACLGAVMGTAVSASMHRGGWPEHARPEPLEGESLHRRGVPVSRQERQQDQSAVVDARRDVLLLQAIERCEVRLATGARWHSVFERRAVIDAARGN